MVFSAQYTREFVNTLIILPQPFLSGLCSLFIACPGGYPLPQAAMARTFAFKCFCHMSPGKLLQPWEHFKLGETKAGWCTGPSLQGAARQVKTPNHGPARTGLCCCFSLAPGTRNPLPPSLPLASPGNGGGRWTAQNVMTFS